MNNLEDSILFGTLKLKGKKKIYIRKDCVFLITDKKHKEEEIIEIIDYKIIGYKKAKK